MVWYGMVAIHMTKKTTHTHGRKKGCSGDHSASERGGFRPLPRRVMALEFPVRRAGRAGGRFFVITVFGFFYIKLRVYCIIIIVIIIIRQQSDGRSHSISFADRERVVDNGVWCSSSFFLSHLPLLIVLESASPDIHGFCA